MKWWVSRDGRRIDVAARRLGERFEVEVDGRLHAVELVRVSPGLASLLAVDGRSFVVVWQRPAPGRYRVALGEREFEVQLRHPLEREVAQGAAAGAGPQEVRAPIPGKVVSVAVAAGARVIVGQPLLVLEAMKMENQLCAEGEGTIEQVNVGPGDTVESGQVLIVLGG